MKVRCRICGEMIDAEDAKALDMEIPEEPSPIRARLAKPYYFSDGEEALRTVAFNRTEAIRTRQ